MRLITGLRQDGFIAELTQLGSGKAATGKMDAARIKKAFEDFPWITTYIPLSGINQIHLAKPSIVDVDRTLQITHICDPSKFFDRRYVEQAYLVDAHGKLLEHYEPFFTYRPRFFLFGDMIEVKKKKRYTGEVPAEGCVKHTLETLKGDGYRLQYILSYHPFTKVVIIYQVTYNELTRLFREEAEWREPMCPPHQHQPHENPDCW